MGSNPRGGLVGAAMSSFDTFDELMDFVGVKPDAVKAWSDAMLGRRWESNSVQDYSWEGRTSTLEVEVECILNPVVRLGDYGKHLSRSTLVRIRTAEKESRTGCPRTAITGLSRLTTSSVRRDPGCGRKLSWKVPHMQVGENNACDGWVTMHAARQAVGVRKGLTGMNGSDIRQRVGRKRVGRKPGRVLIIAL